jgi:hypothetical protein
MLDSAEPRNNFLLAALPDPEWQRWQPLLETVEMPLGQGTLGPFIGLQRGPSADGASGAQRTRTAP